MDNRKRREKPFHIDADFDTAFKAIVGNNKTMEKTIVLSDFEPHKIPALVGKKLRLRSIETPNQVAIEFIVLVIYKKINGDIVKTEQSINSMAYGAQTSKGDFFKPQEFSDLPNDQIQLQLYSHSVKELSQPVTITYEIIS